MDLYLAGIQGNRKKFVLPPIPEEQKKLFILESFVYVDDFMTGAIPCFRSFLLDSGAFTFMQNSKEVPRWEDYVRRYAEYIVQNKIELFFELDIDVIVGLKKVEELRQLLERLTGKQPIPVWHKDRGKTYYLDMVKNYPYVAIGGIVTKEIKQNEYRFFPWFIDKAHEYGAKVHGLGFTSLTGLQKYRFDSVDSTSWLYGNRGGFLYRFNGKTMDKFPAPPGMGLKSKEGAIHNFNEWVKFQRYAEKSL